MQRSVAPAAPPSSVSGQALAAPPSPTALFSTSLALTGESQLLNFFVNTYRTPPFLLPIYLAANERYGVPWQILAAINEVETDYGFDLSLSSAGAEGWMQFLPPEWLAYGVDANGAGTRDPYNPADAIFAAARYLAAAGAAHDVRGAIFAYNHSSSYVESVILRSRLIAATPQSLIGGLTAIVTGRLPVGGGGPHTATPVLIASPQRPARSATAAPRSSAGQGAPAPPPAQAAAGSSAAPGKAVGGVNVTASPGAPVLAVQNAEVTGIGRNARLGRYIELRDAYGDTYTYARLGTVLGRYALPRRSTQRAGAQPPPPVLAPLRKGASIASGTTLGSVPGGAPGTPVHFLFEIRPAGAGPIDPRPVLQAWQLLGQTEGHPQSGAAPLFGPNATGALISEIELMSAPQLQADLLSDPRLRLYTCGRLDIAGGQIDRRVLEVLDFLLASGIDPTVSALECGKGGEAISASVSEHARGDAVSISALNGVPIRAHAGRGSLVEVAAHRLLTLPGALRPHEILGPLRLRGTSGTLVRPGYTDRLDVGFAPAAPASGAPASASPKPAPVKPAPGLPTGSAAAVTKGPSSAPPVSPSAPQSAPELGTAQWRRLIARISQLAEPRVPPAPTSASAADNPSSPPPSGGVSSASAPLPQTGSQPAASEAKGATEASPQAAPAPLDLNASPSALATPLAAEPHVVLETESPPTSESVFKGVVTLKAAVTGLSVATYQFQFAPAESNSCPHPGGIPSESCWTTMQSSAASNVVFNTETATTPDGLYDFRVLVTDTAAVKYKSELRDRLIANESPVVTLADPGPIVKGRITLKATVPRTEMVTSVSFQWATAGSGEWNTIEKVPHARSSGGVTTSLDTTRALPADGLYDFRAVPENEAEAKTYASIPVRARLVDNTPPSVSVTNPRPGSSLSGQVKLEASAVDPGGSGVSSVRFQVRSGVGATAWRDVGKVTLASQPNTYLHALNTESLQNGSYEFRAIAENRAGSEAPSPVVAGVEVHNSSLAPAVSASILGVATPAEHVTFLGEIAGSPQHEAWAYGFTSAPPAEVEGRRLTYTAEGEQLVLLRYTDEGGWQIADVLEQGTEGGPEEVFKLLASDKVRGGRGNVHVAGAMTPSGEAWLWVTEASGEAGKPPVFGLFHRRPGGRFLLDNAATGAFRQPAGGSLLESFEAGGDRLSLGQAPGGQAYGLLTIFAGFGKLPHYALLQEGSWKLDEEEPSPAALHLPSGESVALKVGDSSGPGEAWGAFELGNPRGRGLALGHLKNGAWGVEATGLDALDLTGAFAAFKEASVEPISIKADGDAVWIEARVDLTPGKESGRVLARYEGPANGAGGHVTNSWCTLPVANSCEEPLESPGHAAAVPDAIFQTEAGPVALALKNESVDVFAHGTWTSVAAAPGYGDSPSQPGDDVFSSPNEGWLGGRNAAALGHWSAAETASGSGTLASWPLPDRSPLTGVALPPGSQGGVGESGALAVGYEGTTLSYDASTGWQVQPTPPRSHHIGLLGVAFAGPSNAFAVGQFGAILHWDGTAWSEDPQSISLTQSQLNAVAFAPSGEGWAVGANGTILHYDGRSWSSEAPPPTDSGVDITSVAAAGSEVFAVAGGNLITRSPGEGWHEVGDAQLPSSPKPAPGNLRLVAGLPDGGVVAAGKSIVLVREAAGQPFAYDGQPLEGIAVALTPYRQADGKLRAYVSVAPPVPGRRDVAGSPAGDGELMRQTGNGWQDLSHAQFAGGATVGDGAVKSDPVLAIATDPTGEHTWAVGGYDGTEDAAEQGTEEILSSRVGWETASIWRYDTGGSAQPPPKLTPATPSLPAKPGTVSFAFFTSPMCREECAKAPNAQPDVNLTAAAKQIAAYAEQPGGPAFAMLGGNAVGPLEGSALNAGNGEVDFAHLPELLSPLSGVPTFAALGRFDRLPGRSDEARPWAEAFATAPPPFGSGPGAPGIEPVSSGGPTGEVHRYYAFDAAQNEGTLRVITLDNSKGSLEGSSEGQEGWLMQQLASANAAGTPIVVITSEPLRNKFASDGEHIASLLAEAGVLAVFTTDGAIPGQVASEVHEFNEHHLIPEEPGPGVGQIPEYEGASLGYQQTENNGVAWYYASIDTRARSVHIAAVPVVDSLSLKALDGLSVARSLTLRFEAIGRRPAGTLATKALENPKFQGYDDYVEIPAPGCKRSRPCLNPSYAFTSSDRAVGDFVEPSGPGSPLPRLNAGGHPIPSSTSGLFCAFNSGTTTISISAGLLSYSLPVTVQPGGFGAPCGTVFKAGVGGYITKVEKRTQRAPKGAGAPAPPPAALAGVTPSLSFVPPPPAPQAPPAAPAPKAAPPPPAQPAPVVEPPPTLVESVGAPPALLPAATPPVEPIPPGAGGYAQSPSTAERKEKARKHASQSASFTIRPAGATGAIPTSGTGDDWFYVAAGITTLLALLLSARALPMGPRPRPVFVHERPVMGARRRPRQP